jgi:hypothetical protein
MMATEINSLAFSGAAIGNHHEEPALPHIPSTKPCVTCKTETRESSDHELVSETMSQERISFLKKIIKKLRELKF